MHLTDILWIRRSNFFSKSGVRFEIWTLLFFFSILLSLDRSTAVLLHFAIKVSRTLLKKPQILICTAWCMYLNPSLITNLLTEMEGCPFPTLVGIWWNPLRKHRAPHCYDEVNIPECNYNFGACCFRQIIRLLELHPVVFWGMQLFKVVANYKKNP